MEISNNKYVYFHINPSKNEIFYVGIGKGYRYSQKYRSDFWCKYIKKYPDYNIIIVHDNLTDEEAIKYEKDYIKQIGRRNLGLGPLLNLTDGGDGLIGYKHSKDTIEKISKSKSNLSDETRYKMSIVKIGKHSVRWNKGRINKEYVRTLLNNGLKVCEISKLLNVDQSWISRIKNNKV
jgi:predicted GIY-YIG superfamily endonuclease